MALTNRLVNFSLKYHHMSTYAIFHSFLQGEVPKSHSALLLYKTVDSIVTIQHFIRAAYIKFSRFLSQFIGLLAFFNSYLGSSKHCVSDYYTFNF